MENPAAKRRAKGDDDDDDDVVGSDRISQLPESLLLHMLCFLSHKKAVQTSVLSKSWRHLGPTRPIIHIRAECDLHPYTRRIGAGCEDCFNGNNEAFISVLEKTFQRYHNLNLYAQEIDIEMLYHDSKSIRVLKKWIPIFINPDKPAVTTFRLKFNRGLGFNLPSIVWKSESLRELDLCMLGKIDSINNALLKNLQKLSLDSVKIFDEDLEKIIASCPLVKCVALHGCWGLETINIGNKNHHLNNFEHFSYIGVHHETSVEIDAPTLESINIVECSNWYRSHNNYFPNLKSLFLSRVKLLTESFVNFSCNFPRLQELTLDDCNGFKEIKLYSCSIKRLIIHLYYNGIEKFDVEVPNILHFEFSSSSLPTCTFYLTTTSTEWKSHLNFRYCVYGKGEDVLPRIFKLFEMVKALSQSQISLTLIERFDLKMKQIKWDFNDHPVVVEHLCLDIGKLCPDDSPTHFLNALLRIIRPRYINAVNVRHTNDEEVTEFLWNTLMHKREKTEYVWDQHLEEVSIEASDQNEIVWHHVQCSRSPEWSKNQKFRFRLKWRDLVDY